jgi:hypothetical protein
MRMEFGRNETKYPIQPIGGLMWAVHGLQFLAVAAMVWAFF